MARALKTDGKGKPRDGHCESPTTDQVWRFASSILAEHCGEDPEDPTGSIRVPWNTAVI